MTVKINKKKNNKGVEKDFINKNRTKKKFFQKYSKDSVTQALSKVRNKVCILHYKKLFVEFMLRYIK